MELEELVDLPEIVKLQLPSLLARLRRLCPPPAKPFIPPV